jgi:excisionase family DNA binding protein
MPAGHTFNQGQVTTMSGNGELPETSGVHGSDRYTMTEAARIKGVSYHTVSRAVRSGKLPAQRLGRMALITAADLQGWRPMRERAPRKYRRPDPDTRGVPPVPALAGTTVVNASYANRLMVAMEQLTEVASAESLSGFGDWVAQWLATSLDRGAAVIWRIEHGEAAARLEGAYGVERASVPTILRDEPFDGLRELSEHQAVAALDRQALGRLGATSWLPEAARATFVPMRAGNDCAGCALVFGTPRDAVLTEDDQAFALRLGSQAAFAMRHIALRQANRMQFLSTTSVFDDLPLQLLATDRQGTVVYANRGFTAFWGDEVRSRSIGRHYTRFVREFRRETLDGVEVRIEDHPLTRALRGDAVAESRYLLPDTGDRPRVFVLSAWPTVDEHGEQSGAVLCAREVTDEFEAAGDPSGSPVEMLAAARRRVELLAELSNEIAQRRDSDDIFSIVASRACAVLDADSSVVLTPDADNDLVIRAAHRIAGAEVGRSLNRLNFPSAILAMAERDLMYVNEEEAGSGGRQLLQEGGARVALLIPLVDNDQALGVLAVHYRDVERLRQVDPDLARAVGRQCGHAVHLRNVVIELEASRRRLLTTLDQLPQAVVIIDAPDGHIVALNREAQGFWGTSAERVSQHATDIELLDEDGAVIPVERHPFLRPLRSRRTEFGVPLITRDRQGELIDIVANLAPVTSRSGELRGAVAVLNRREHFKPIDQAKDEFISVVAHELRNPLTSLRGNLQLLERRLDKLDMPELARERERVGGVIDQVDRIGDLVSRMLDVSRADLGKLTIDTGPADAVSIAQSAIEDVSGQIDDRRLHLDAPAELPVAWDRVRVRQILVNLMTNAIRYAPDGDIHVTIRAVADDQVSIAVRDHGPGVPPKLRRRLFRLYYRFDDGEETADGLAAHQRGLGIGLYISARLARAHGGELSVDDAPGGGAVFTLQLPRTVGPASAPG